MGYETRIHIVSEYTFDIGEDCPPMGEELAMIDLCKCGYNGPLENLMSHYRRKQKDGEKPPFALSARTPDRQQEAVEVLREMADKIKEHANYDSSFLIKLSNDVEDGIITTDRYGDYLGVIPIDEFIGAIEEELKVGEPYRRFEWALLLLKRIRSDWEGRESRLKVVTYGH